jgi:phosphoglycolate phosphatase-like HAD superfamily hydrolase
MKVIFLDHDGVICLSANWGTREKKIRKYIKKTGISEIKNMPATVKLDVFDKKAVKVVNEIVKETGAEIVVSSDWKLHATLAEMQDLYLEYGMIKAPIDYTPQLKDVNEELAGLCGWKGWLEKARAEEIRIWLDNHPEVTHWVAVDDLDMSKNTKWRSAEQEWGLDNFVLMMRPYNEGIKQKGIKEQILKFLL